MLLKVRGEATGATWPEWRADFVVKASEVGITVEVTPAGRRVPHMKTRAKTEGVLFKRRNPATGRVNSLKASKLDPGLKMAGLREAFAQYQERVRLEAEAERAALVEAENVVEVEATPETVETEAAATQTSNLDAVSFDDLDIDLTADYVPGEKVAPAVEPAQPVKAPRVVESAPVATSPVTEPVTAPEPVETPTPAVEDEATPEQVDTEVVAEPVVDPGLSQEQLDWASSWVGYWRQEVAQPLGNRVSTDPRERRAYEWNRQRREMLEPRLAQIGRLWVDQRQRDAFTLVEDGVEADRLAAEKKAKQDRVNAQFATPTAQTPQQRRSRKPGGN